MKQFKLNKYKHRLAQIVQQLLPLAIGTLILMSIGFYNGYPLVYSDTGTYIYSGYDYFIPNDRPISYGLFIKFFSFQFSLWCVVLIQNFLTAYIIWESIKVFIRKNRNTVYYLTIVILTFTTGVAWYSNQIMPDFFTALHILTIYLLAFDHKFSGLKLLFLGIILFFASITHFSHLLIGSSLFIVLLLFKLGFKNAISPLTIPLNFRGLVRVGLLTTAAWIGLATINYNVESEFILSKGGHVFLMAHLNQTGILKKILDENCGSAEFQDCTLCFHKDSLPRDIDTFIWGGEFLERSGGWLGSKKDYDLVIKKSLKTPKYLVQNIYKSLLYGFSQLTHNSIGEGLSAYNEGSAPYGQIHWRYNTELNEYLNSKQNKWNGINLNFDLLTNIQWLVIFLSMITLILLLSGTYSHALPLDIRVFILFVLFAIVINSLVTAGLSTPYARYSSRVVWMLPLAICISLAKKVCQKQEFDKHIKSNKR